MVNTAPCGGEMAAAKAELRALAARLRRERAQDAPECDFLAPLLSRAEFRAARAVALFLPLPGEPDTAVLCAHCHGADKTVAVPAWDAPARSYFFCVLSPGAPLAESRFGVREPVVKIPLAAEAVDLFLVPGLMFDAAGNRLGRGKGFYDRLLAPRRADALVWALAFGWQLSPSPIPAEAHDVRMDAVITPCAPGAQTEGAP